MDEHYTNYSWISSSDRCEIDRLGIEVVNPSNHSFNIHISSAASNTIHKLRVFVNAPYNHLKVGGPGVIQGAIQFFSTRSLIVFGGYLPDNNSLKMSINIFGASNEVLWGKGSTSNGISIVCAGTHKSIKVGSDCMVANGSGIRNSDMHGIFCLKSLELNEDAMNVTIGDHCWLGQDSLILKGVHVQTGSIIGAKSLVVKSVGPATIVGGVPAKVIRRNVSWSRRFHPTKEQIATEIKKWQLLPDDA